MPEEEAGVTPLARRQVAGQHELADHALLAAQLLWLVNGEHLVGGIMYATKVDRHYSSVTQVKFNYSDSRDGEKSI